MSTVKLYGWEPGMQKVSVTLAIKEHAGLDLAAAKKITDDVLDGKECSFTLTSEVYAHAFLNALDALGVKAKIIRINS